MDTDIAKDDAKLTFLGEVRDAVAVLTVFVFFCGFVYRYFYLMDLGVQPCEIDLPPIYVFLADAWNVFASKWLYFLGAAVSLVFLFIFGKRVARKVQCGKTFSDNARKNMQMCGVMFIGVLSLLTIYDVSRLTAQQISSEVRRGNVGYPSTFSFKEELLKRYPELADANKNDHLRIIAESGDRVYVLYQASPEGDSLPAEKTYALSKHEILSYYTLVP